MNSHRVAAKTVFHVVTTDIAKFGEIKNGAMLVIVFLCPSRQSDSIVVDLISSIDSNAVTLKIFTLEIND